jgi:Tfp pilus assembly protein PilO
MKRRALIELLLALSLLTVVLAAYGIWYVAVGKASAEAAALSEEIKTKSIDSARVASAKEALESLAADEETMRSYLVRKMDVVSFLERLEDAGGSLGTSIEVVSVGAESVAGREALKLSLKITGSFDGVLRTLGALEYGPYDTRMLNVTLDTTLGTDGAAGAWTATATLLIGTQP